MFFELIWRIFLDFDISQSHSSSGSKVINVDFAKSAVKNVDFAKSIFLNLIVTGRVNDHTFLSRSSPSNQQKGSSFYFAPPNSGKFTTILGGMKRSASHCTCKFRKETLLVLPTLYVCRLLPPN